MRVGACYRNSYNNIIIKEVVLVGTMISLISQSHSALKNIREHRLTPVSRNRLHVTTNVPSTRATIPEVAYQPRLKACKKLGLTMQALDSQDFRRRLSSLPPPRRRSGAAPSNGSDDPPQGSHTQSTIFDSSPYMHPHTIATTIDVRQRNTSSEASVIKLDA